MARIETSKVEIIKCLSQLPKSDHHQPLEWKINTLPDEYLNPNIDLLLEVSLTKRDGTPLTDRMDMVRSVLIDSLV